MSLEQLVEMARKADQEDRHAAAVEIFKAAYNMDPDMSSYLRFRLADNLRIIGRFDESKRLYEAVDVKEVPAKKLWLLYLHQGQLFSDTGDLPAALACFQRAMELHPAETVAYVYLGALKGFHAVCGQLGLTFLPLLRCPNRMSTSGIR